MQHQNSRNRSLMEIWWWTSVPYSLLFFLSAILFRASFFLAHIGLPFLYLFEFTLWSSIAWTVVSIARFVTTRRFAASAPSAKAMFVLSLASCCISIYYFNRVD